MKKIVLSYFLAHTVFLAACQESSTPQITNVVSQAVETTKSTIFTGKDIIWGMDFLPNGQLIFTEKKGKVFLLKDGEAKEQTGFPEDVEAASQGGLLDIKVHPNYEKNGWIYASYNSKPEGSSDTQLNLIRFKISNNKIKNIQSIFHTEATNGWKGHNGSRIVFDNDGFLWLSVGEGGQTSRGGKESKNQNAQNVNSGWGKIHRMTDEGKIPQDNPVLPGASKATTVWSYGHRNPQGLVFNPFTNQIFETEHGPKGGDELNLIEKGKNYGWPWISYGINYDGVSVSDSPKMDGMQDPVTNWVPSIGACGLTILTKDTFGPWKGNLIAGGLALQYILRLELKDGKVVNQTKMLENHRVRCVKEGPEGDIYVAVENPARIIKISPRK